MLEIIKHYGLFSIVFFDRINLLLAKSRRHILKNTNNFGAKFFKYFHIIRPAGLKTGDITVKKSILFLKFWIKRVHNRKQVIGKKAQKRYTLLIKSDKCLKISTKGKFMSIFKVLHRKSLKTL